MILFPNAKINLGLNIISRRPDGYHELLTVMSPVGWCDVLEIVSSRSGETTLKVSGRTVDCPPERNLVMKAYNALAAEVGGLPPAEIYLEKIIPDGAGLGGGSADAAFTIRGLNEVFALGLDNERMAAVAGRVGADCSFFIYNRPAYCTGIGTDISLDVSPTLSADQHIVIAKPRGASVSTAQAYAGITPKPADCSPRDVVATPVSNWRGKLVNDFETSVFAREPRCASLKQHMYDTGATYAAMSGSGAAVFGIFGNDKMAQSAADTCSDCDIFVGSAVLK